MALLRGVLIGVFLSFCRLCGGLVLFNVSFNLEEGLLFVGESQRVKRAFKASHQSAFHLFRGIYEAFHHNYLVGFRVHSANAYEGTTHAIILHVPQSAGFHGKVLMDHNGLYHRTQGVCGHVHVGLFAGQVFFHYAVTLGQHIFFVEGFGTFVGITVHADILQAGCRIVAGPEEIIAFLVALQLLGSKELALELEENGYAFLNN